jgi:hypothetical protein
MNPKLKKGDRVLLLYMSGESGMFPGEGGTVTSVDNVFGDIQYGVKWDNGSSLALLSDTDAWKLEKKQIKENELDRMNVLYKNLDVFEFFKMAFLYKYLRVIREASIVNMFQAPPYLWMGKERIEHEFKYRNIHNEESFEEMLNMSNQAQSEMINGVINYLESKGIEENMDNINKYLRKFATMIVQNYMHIG